MNGPVGFPQFFATIIKPCIQACLLVHKQQCFYSRVVFNRKHLLPGNIWQCLETFLLSQWWGRGGRDVLLASSG